jgi:hypothetical protein
MQLKLPEDSKDETFVPQSRIYFSNVTRDYALHLTKGNYFGKKLVAWIPLQPCHAERCPVAHLCPYESRKSKGGLKKCGLQHKYMDTIARMIQDNFVLRMTEPQLFRIGTELIPLYMILARLKMVELGTKSPEITTLRGEVRIHPVYREIRETMRAIESKWRALGMSKAMVQFYPELPLEGGGDDNDGQQQDGMDFFGDVDNASGEGDD